MSQEAVIDAQDAEQMHEAMDYAQHQGTWETFIGLVKWSIIELALLVVALFCYIQAGQPVLGTLLIIIGLLLIPGSMLFGSRR